MNSASLPARHPCLCSAALTALLLAPFLGKAIHLDDPLFLWSARQILQNPFDPLGTQVNWDGWQTPLHWIMLNPPGASYYLALIGGLCGFQELPLHLAFLLPACALAAGTCRLARQLQAAPLQAVAISLACPAVLVRASGLMCDIPMLACWVWAIVCWQTGLERKRPGLTWCAGLLICLSAGMKYFGLCLVPLLLCDGLLRRERPGPWLLGLLLPLLTTGTWFLLGERLYGHDLLAHLASYSGRLRELTSLQGPRQLLVGLAFSGGGFLPLVFFLPRTLGRRCGWATTLTAALLLALLLWYLGDLGRIRFRDPQATGATVDWLALGTSVLFLLGGLHLWVLVGINLWRNPDRETLLLCGWIAGTFLFATFLNWTTNARSLLPMAPAVAILLARTSRLEERPCDGGPNAPAWLRQAPLALSLALTLLVTQADYLWANRVRDTALDLIRRHDHAQGRLWFRGHWGFQWYLEGQGATHLELSSTRLRPGDRVLVAKDLDGQGDPPAECYDLIEHLEIPAAPYCATMSARCGAGFYSSIWGPLPFVIRAVPPGQYEVWLVTREHTFGR